MNNQVGANSQLPEKAPDNGARCFNEIRRLILATGGRIGGNSDGADFFIPDTRTIRILSNDNDSYDFHLLQDGSIAISSPLKS